MQQSHAQLYKDAYEEAQRIIRISDEVRISLERVPSEPDGAVADEDGADAGKLTTSKLGQKLGLKTAQVLERAATAGYVEALSDNKYGPTAKGEQAGVEYVAKSRFGPYFRYSNRLCQHVESMEGAYNRRMMLTKGWRPKKG